MKRQKSYVNKRVLQRNAMRLAVSITSAQKLSGHVLGKERLTAVRKAAVRNLSSQWCFILHVVSPDLGAAFVFLCSRPADRDVSDPAEPRGF